MKLNVSGSEEYGYSFSCCPVGSFNGGIQRKASIGSNACHLQRNFEREKLFSRAIKKLLFSGERNIL